ncbi:MAG: DinB family protein [Mucilaginibacter sp.]
MEKLLLSSFLEIFDEVYIGPQNDNVWVVDRDPGLGFIDVIRTVSAEDASKSFYTGGSTLAGHTEHLRWSLNFALTYLRGKQPDTDWSKSWAIKTVNEAEWGNLQLALQNEYIAMRDTVEQITDWSNPFTLKGVLALLPHAAYHLGSIKQKLLYLKGVSNDVHV